MGERGRVEFPEIWMIDLGQESRLMQFRVLDKLG